MYAIFGENASEWQRRLVESTLSTDDQGMDWQTITTTLILAVAAGIIFSRLWAIVRSGKVGSCGSCAGCGDSAKDKAPKHLVQLTTHQIKGGKDRLK